MAKYSEGERHLGVGFLAGPVFSAIVFSCALNALGLAGPLFMLEVYDRVIPSRSTPTLVALLILLAGLFAFSAFLEIIRGRAMSRIAGIVDAAISQKVASVIAGARLKTSMSGDILKPAQEADQIRAFLASPALASLFDLPWMPIYLGICFFLHPLIGWLAAGTMGVLLALAVLSDVLTRRKARQTAEAISERNRLGEATSRNAEAVAAMGLLSTVTRRWAQSQERVASLQRSTGDTASLFSGISRSLRQMVQSGSLALGAWLVIQGDMTAGSIIAASIIVARALQPIEQLIGNWRTMTGAGQSWGRLQSIFRLFPSEVERTQLPAPHKTFSVEGVFAAPPGERNRMTVQNVSFRVTSGTVVGIIGPSASGKSSLMRVLSGVWPATRGQVCLDAAALDQWSAAERGRHIGYMPQSSDLFPGTIAQNIARLDTKAAHGAIVSAAQAAGVHEMIVGLPDGYETEVGDGGLNLSAGQRQRVALARALFGNPFLVILDEPNSNLDAEGDRALSEAIAGLKARGAIVLVVAHRNSVMAQIDMLLVMENSIARAFGPREAVMRSLQQQQAKRVQSTRSTSAPSLTVIEGEGA